MLMLFKVISLVLFVLYFIVSARYILTADESRVSGHKWLAKTLLLVTAVFGFFTLIVITVTGA